VTRGQVPVPVRTLAQHKSGTRKALASSSRPSTQSESAGASGRARIGGVVVRREHLL
jgi:hypothetical protein